PYKREALKAVAEKYIKSSEAVLELMYAYIEAKENELCKLVVERLFSEKCTHGVRIKKLFENGDLVCKELHILDSEEKEGGKSKDGMTVTELRKKLSFLNLQQWVMSATGGNDNEGARKRFNTPFYPDIIVCTDVFKEGINLHLFCNHVYHYGLAWTPGDLEQRVGRVDRVFSKTYRERIEQGKKTKVKINYPYLGNSIDELQLKQVLKFKVSADLLLDSKHEVQKDIQVDDLEEKSVDDLAKYKPEPKKVDNEPYSGKKFWKGT
ncbi:MAG: helicase C-terminal domain-containing protein, partial [Treponemataceae bacterium]|nr:helicase C-terminal domain-containing protein [Treponemataceae bacterium]